MTQDAVKSFLETEEGKEAFRESVERVLFQNPEFFREVISFVSSDLEKKHPELKGETLKKDVEKVITDILDELGGLHSLYGYKYTKQAIMLILEEPERMYFMTKEVYPMIAEKYNTSASKVERAIRYFITRIFSLGNMEKIQKYFSYTYSSKRGMTTNSEFIAAIKDFILLQQK